MIKQVYKILPDGSPSGLSLNKFKVYMNKASKWNGVAGQEIYSMKLFKEKIFELYPNYKLVPNFDVLEFIQANYTIDNRIWNVIEELIDGLVSIVISLYEGNEISVSYNENLFDSDWKFWKKCKYIILDGKLLFGSLGDKIVKTIQDKFNENKLYMQIIKLADFTKVNTVSLLGCAYGNNYNKQYVFDFGNTAVKRGIAIKKNGEIELTELPSIHHEDFWSFPDSNQSASYVDDFVVTTILNTIYEVEKKTEEKINISLCMANNILNNCIANRGSYRHLRLLNENYNNHLTCRLVDKLNKEVNVNIYNDAEAVGRIFYDFSPDTAIITLGTLLGIAYPPNTNKYSKNTL